MTKRHLSSGIILLAAVFLITGCDTNDDTGPEAHDVAIEYFELLYNQRDLPAALELTSNDYRPILERYGSIAAIGSYLYDMNYDQVTIEADEQGIQLYRDQAETARVQLSFSGLQGKRKVETLRNVVMVREDGEWRLSRVLDGRW